MTGENVTTFFVLILIFGTGITIPVSMFWFDYRARTRALEILRVYAERGEEPPPAVTQVLIRASARYSETTSASGWPPKAADDDKGDRIGRPRTRGGFLAHVAANAVFTAGFSTFAWWRYSELGEASTGVIVSIFVALFFAASVAAQLVGAYYAPAR